MNPASSHSFILALFVVTVLSRLYIAMESNIRHIDESIDTSICHTIEQWGSQNHGQDMVDTNLLRLLLGFILVWFYFHAHVLDKGSLMKDRTGIKYFSSVVRSNHS